jgi:mercuric ion transport protein
VDNNKLIVTGVTGAAITTFCSTCGAPLLATVLAALGLSAWLDSIDYMLLAVMVLFLGLAGYGLYRQRGEGTGTYPSPYRSTGQALRSEERGEGIRETPAMRNEVRASASTACFHATDTQPSRET